MGNSSSGFFSFFSGQFIDSFLPSSQTVIEILVVIFGIIFTLNILESLADSIV